LACVLLAGRVTELSAFYVNCDYQTMSDLSIRKMEDFIGGGGRNRVARAQRLALTSYLAGGLVSAVIGAFNPQGIVIVLISAAAASLGGTSGLAWEMQFMNRETQSSQVPFQLERHWGWIVAGVITILLYGIILGPSIKL
jgi:hypothetical protein